MAKRPDRPSIKIERPGHIIILDERWHELFSSNKTFKVSQLEKKLAKLLKEQGKVNTEYEGYKKLKKQMMDEIVENMEDNSKEAEEQKKKNSRYISEINKKFNLIEERKANLPEEIEKVNTELLTESMIQCYEKLIARKEKLVEMTGLIDKIKEDLKQKVGDKEDMEQEINRLYGFMHDIAGFEALEAFDEHYFGDKG